MKTYHIAVAGTVQGVFFRKTIHNEATELGLKGYAKNLPDGRVEVVVQGDKQMVDALTSFISSSPGASKVADMQIKETDEQELRPFEIRL